MKTFLVLLLMLLCSSAYAGEQWYQCTGYVKAPSLPRFGYEHEACGAKHTVRSRFLPWLAQKIIELEHRTGEKVELVDIVCEPTHVACVDE